MSFDVKKILSQFGLSKEAGVNQGLVLNDPEFNISEEDILDLSQINFDNDETWLFERSEGAMINKYVPLPISNMTETTSDHYLKKLTKESNLKNINTQTFTRPKKKFIRPSIEKYNQELFADNNETMNISSSSESPNISNTTITTDYTQGRPLEFDLTQSAGSYYFENLAANVSSEDCFQNMSPPSLVNSLCSSTFTNLMESSFIKNDPVLKQICDTDFTTSILSQGSEPPSLIQSLCYSTNSVEDFLTKVSQDELMKHSESNGAEIMCSGDASFIVHKKESCDKDKNIANIMDLEEYHDASDTNFTERQNGTYRKNNRLSSMTFRKTDPNRTSTRRNHTFEIEPKDVEEAYNATLTIESPKSTRTVILKGFNDNLQKSNSLENMKNSSIVKDSCNNDLSRYDSKENDLGNCKGDSKKSLECSIGSADSLDRMSTLSSSSKGSNKMLNMEEVEAIAEKQEQSLHVMSTPKPNWANKVINKMMWDSFLSPIEVQTDSGESSDEYKSVKSSFSKNSLESNPVQQTRSLVSLQDPPNSRKMKSVNTIVNQTNLLKGPMRNSASNLTNVGVPPSKLLQSRIASAGNVKSNLITMKPALKGSYTSLKPVNTHLPVAPPINATPQGHNATYLSSVNATVEIQEARNNRHDGVDGNTIKMSGDGVFLKPSIPIRSGLPRPTSATNIPRPVSKIPGPKRFTLPKHDPSKIGT
ncbi:hypothetical protein WA026_014062 [Henosepilachna vigintioctopunctata]|uniref:Uncharacterized protein n=1 Tax=Henosepilachna vigintioctopunctata TaxID=420089 RepID=A0AAW1U2B3_9CUCU